MAGSKQLLGLILVAAICTMIGCGSTEQEEEQSASRTESAFHPETVNRTYAELGMITDMKGVSGTPARVPCKTCHGMLAKHPVIGDGKAETFHDGIGLAHGEMSCHTCHVPPDYQRFVLAGGEKVEYAQVMDLCSQCHGQQRQDYDHGVHGGMSGYWDLARGPRIRNHCLDCHNAHRPAIQQMRPAPYPRYRFVEDDADGSTHSQTENREGTDS